MTRRYTRLTSDEWSCLLNLYSTGVNTIPELAERYEVSTSSITAKARAAGITRLAKFAAVVGGDASTVEAINEHGASHPTTHEAAGVFKAAKTSASKASTGLTQISGMVMGKVAEAAGMAM